ncbi:hypothetical protein K8S19_05655 [bacterium]|nr:hypothetical protein [bacterium]
MKKILSSILVLLFSANMSFAGEALVLKDEQYIKYSEKTNQLTIQEIQEEIEDYKKGRLWKNIVGLTTLSAGGILTVVSLVGGEKGYFGLMLLLASIGITGNGVLFLVLGASDSNKIKILEKEKQELVLSFEPQIDANYYGLEFKLKF